MKPDHRLFFGSALFAAVSFAASIAGAQQKPAPVPHSNTSYQLSRETALQGAVISFTTNSQGSPAGAHVTIQTASGAVDVHLGNANLLAASHFTLSPGDTVRVVGETIVTGKSSQFLARIIQKGGQSLTVRSVRGFPLRPVATDFANRPGGVL
jgi:hypothetical protein